MRYLLVCLLLLSSCKSPQGDWMDRSIARDFKKWEKRGISKELLEKSWEACKRHKEFHRYQIIDSKVYGPESRIKILLEEMVLRYPVPDVDFIYYYEDRIKPSFFKRSSHRQSAPLFASAKHKDLDAVILFADWNYDIRDPVGGWNGLREKIDRAKSDWSQKKDILFWRGTPWDGKHFGMYDFENWKSLPRGKLVAYSMQEPSLIDAAFSEYPNKCTYDLERCAKEMGPIRFVPWEEVLRHKYHMIVDGVTCTFPATQWKLLSGCLCFKQESEEIQYYYDELKPWVHYIPVRYDLSDLQEKLNWAKTHDRQAQEISNNAREFVQTHLMPEHILFYCYKVLCKYAALNEPSRF